MKILVAALTNLFFVSSAVFAEEGVGIICEAKKESLGGIAGGELIERDGATAVFHDYKIFDDRLETSFGGSCAKMTGIINGTDINVLCSGDSASLMVQIDRRNGKYSYTYLGTSKDSTDFALQNLEGICKKATGF